MISKRRCFICGIKSTKLNNVEYDFLNKYKPWGIILFSRNIKSIKQTKILVTNIKQIFNDINYPILIDEEGGRVSRISKIIDNSKFTASYFGKIYKKDKKEFNKQLDMYIDRVSKILNLTGINFNTVPVLDISRKNTHKIIGNRSYSNNKSIVSKIGSLVIKKFKKNKINTIIKHIPGHGLAKTDSHVSLPKINKNLAYLLKNDFYPFRQNSYIAMTAHLLFNKIDQKKPVTHSKKMIEIIRSKIGFKGILLTDDISMKALKYSLSENIKLAFTAGCNIVLHCNANFREMEIVAKNSPLIDKFIIKKTSQMLKNIS